MFFSCVPSWNDATRSLAPERLEWREIRVIKDTRSRGALSAAAAGGNRAIRNADALAHMRRIDSFLMWCPRAHTVVALPPSCMDAPPGATYARGMRERLENWRDVSLAEFEAFLRGYPRPLEARPALSQRNVNFRAWLDASLGEWPDNVVAKAWTRGRCKGFQILLGR